ncbi:KDEL motif-containing protein 1, partial [Exaiptasia diaphana]
MGRKKPELYDVALTNFFFFPYDEKKYGPKMKHISFFDFFKWKYQINIDGTVAAYRFPYLIAGDAVVFKQDSNYYEHFYKELKPWVHYIPFKRDLSDIEDKLNWAIHNDQKAQKIAQQAQQFARENLQARDVFCYHWVLFKEYARRQSTKPKIHKGMEHIKQPDDHESQCDCLRRPN